MSDHSPTSPPPVVLRLETIQRILALSRSAIYARMAAGDFPPPLHLGPRAIGWLQSDIDAWLESRIRGDLKQGVTK
jgi:prophage regulatory protein